MKMLKIFKFNIRLVLDGVGIDFYRLIHSNAENEDDQLKILKSGGKVLAKTTEGSVAHQTALETMADVYMRRHEFEKAANGFNCALEVLIKNSKNLGSVKSSLSYLSLCLASCYQNMGERDKVVATIFHAIKIGVDVDEFNELIDSRKLKELLLEAEEASVRD